MKNEFTRRSFLGFLGLSTLTCNPRLQSEENSLETNSLKILFQGDSITDGNRGRSNDPNHILGHGYAFAIASGLGATNPGRRLSFINKGNSGDTVEALQARWKADALDLKPDVISILVGVNNVFHRIRSGNATAPSMYAYEIRKLMESTRQSLPGTKLVLCEPFILPVGMVNEDTERWSAEIKTVQQATATVATEFNCIYVRFQQLFNNALKQAPADYWIWDGIHPTYNGHGLMAKEWMREVGKAIPVLKP
jgi:lysophospholipase L1-like esterase